MDFLPLLYPLLFAFDGGVGGSFHETFRHFFPQVTWILLFSIGLLLVARRPQSHIKAPNSLTTEFKHELNNHLQCIMANAEVGKQMDNKDPVEYECYEKIIESTQRARLLVSQFNRLDDNSYKESIPIARVAKEDKDLCEIEKEDKDLCEIKIGFESGVERILVVDDEPGARHIAASQLRRAGYDVSVAHNGEHALKIVNTSVQSFDLLVLDVIMAKKDGYTVFKEVQALYPHTPAVFVTGNTHLASHDMLLEPHLTKPYRQQALLQLVRKTLDLQPS